MKKRQKSKMTMLVVGGLAAVSLVSVGFASWVITGAPEVTGNINVSVGEVDNQSLTTKIIPAGVGGSDLSVSFDNTGETVTGILTIPRLKLKSGLSMQLGQAASPAVGTFYGEGYPTGKRGHKVVSSLLILSQDIDEDL